MKKILIPLIVISLFPVLLSASIFGKTGTASLQFLKLGVDARAIGMGEAYTAVTNDISSVYWNPAGIAQNFDKQIMFSHTNWPADIMHEYVAYSQETEYGIFGIHASILHMDDMEVTEEYLFGPTGEKFTSSDVSVGLTYAQAFTDKFSFGITAKYLREDIWDDNINSFAVDLGTLYNTGYKNLTIGMALRNFGPDVKYEIDNDEDGHIDEDPFDLFDNDGDGVVDEDGPETEFKIPMNFSLGVAMDVFREDNSYWIVSAQLDNCVDRKETWNLGTEYNINNLYLRAGKQINLDAANWSMGFGVKMPTRMGTFNVDYAYTDMGRLAESFLKSAHRISVKLAF
ncbi:MAG TPA: PorV/PorQ family protein [Candidatus Cloacimonadota bacterium]|nr:PorV/PorQ family protein [Candidatus Cloacimonadota bacterium]HOQ81133.1 PorV/PorQ family protein [Candidatus Cloacimonadota bacterium]